MQLNFSLSTHPRQPGGEDLGRARDGLCLHRNLGAAVAEAIRLPFIFHGPSAAFHLGCHLLSIAAMTALGLLLAFVSHQFSANSTLKPWLAIVLMKMTDTAAPSPHLTGRKHVGCPAPRRPARLAVHRAGASMCRVQKAFETLCQKERVPSKMMVLECSLSNFAMSRVNADSCSGVFGAVACDGPALARVGR